MDSYGRRFTLKQSSGQPQRQEPIVDRLNPILREILQGVYDAESPLSKLRGLPFTLRMIWKNITAFWKSRIKPSQRCSSLNTRIIGGQAFREYDYVKISPFPKPTGININMMPFVMSEDFLECRLPDYLKPYKVMIRRCCRNKELGKVGFLTIQESNVEANTSQRRPGIHTESPGIVKLRNDFDQVKSDLKVSIGSGASMEEIDLLCYWGGGDGEDSVEYSGGIYMASTIPNSCAIWDCQIVRKNDEPEVVGPLGDVEHLREFLPGYHVMEQNKVYWLTDRTPHESLPLEKSKYRQFFRLVTSNVSIWYEDHSTPNPLGVVPDPEITKIVRGSKFDKDGVVVIVGDKD